MKASDLAKALSGRLLGEDVPLTSIAPLMGASALDLSFIIWPKDIKWAKNSMAGCIICEPGFAADFADIMSSSLIVIENLYDGFARVKNLLDDGQFCESFILKPSRNISSTARIHKTAVIKKAEIGAFTEIDANVVIEDGVIIKENSKIEAGSVIHAGVFIGSRSRIGANSVIGSDGFVPYGANVLKNLASLGNVVIEDEVKVGALCTIDRALIKSTLIKTGTMIDNMVHIGHDVIIGKNVVIAAQSGIAGFVRIDDHVTIGGQVGIAPHIAIGDGARISGKAGVHCDIKPLEIWSGNPSVPHKIYLYAYGRLMNSFRKYYGKREQRR